MRALRALQHPAKCDVEQTTLTRHDRFEVSSWLWGLERTSTPDEECMGLLTLKQSDLSYRIDFAMYGVAVATLGAILLIASPRADFLTCALLALAGLMSWSGIEYLLHRFVLHGLQPFRRWHAEHHRHPAELICSPTILSATLIFALVFLPALGLAGPWHACSLTFGILVGYFSYAVTHHATHHWRARNSWLRQRKQWHAMHHHDSERPRCFGVTSSLWDRLLGTSPSRLAGAGVGPRADRGRREVKMPLLQASPHDEVSRAIH